MISAFHRDESHLSRTHARENKLAVGALSVEEEVVLTTDVVGALSKKTDIFGTQRPALQRVHATGDSQRLIGNAVGHEQAVAHQSILRAHHVHIVVARQQGVLVEYQPGFVASFPPASAPVVEASQIAVKHVMVEEVHLVLYVAVQGLPKVALRLVDGLLNSGA